MNIILILLETSQRQEDDNKYPSGTNSGEQPGKSTATKEAPYHFNYRGRVFLHCFCIYKPAKHENLALIKFVEYAWKK